MLDNTIGKENGNFPFSVHGRKTVLYIVFPSLTFPLTGRAQRALYPDRETGEFYVYVEPHRQCIVQDVLEKKVEVTEQEQKRNHYRRSSRHGIVEPRTAFHYMGSVQTSEQLEPNASVHYHRKRHGEESEVSDPEEHCTAGHTDELYRNRIHRVPQKEKR